MKAKDKISKDQAIEHLEKIRELLKYYLGDREDPQTKELFKNHKLTKELITELSQDQYADRKRFRKKFLDTFVKQKEKLEAENKELKIELKQEKEKK